MVQPLGIEQYHRQLLSLLPRGKAWPKEAGTVISRLLRAEASQLAEIDRVAVGLLNEFLPNLTFDLLEEWEQSVGLPDACTDLGSTIQQRRAAVVNKVVSRLDTNSDTYVRIGREFGIEITVDEHDQARAANDSALDTSGGRWRNVWWVTIPTATPPRRFDVLSDVNTPLLVVERNTELECRLRSASPAHSELHTIYRAT